MKESSAAVEATPAEPGLRERNKQARRLALIDAAQALVRRDGLDAVTVEAICAEAGVSTRTFFNYFESKDDAVLGYEPWDLTSGAAEAFAAGGPTGSLARDLEHLVTAIVDKPRIGHTRIACAMEVARGEPRLLGRTMLAIERHHQALAELVARRLGEAPAAPRTQLVTLVVLTVTRAAYTRWEADGQQGEVRDRIPQVMHDLRALLGDD